MSEVKRSLAAKLSEIARECAYVQKDKSNEFHRYRYASAAAVLEKVNGALAQHRVGVTVHPTVESIVETKNHKGNVERLVTVRALLKLHDGDSGEVFETSGLGSGQDGGDKAVMKAQTAAIKYAWMLALNIATGDDPEDDARTDESASRGPQRQEPARAQASKGARAPKASAPPEREPGDDDGPTQRTQQSAPPAVLVKFNEDAAKLQTATQAAALWYWNRGALKEANAGRDAWHELLARVKNLGVKDPGPWLTREVADFEAKQTERTSTAQ